MSKMLKLSALSLAAIALGLSAKDVSAAPIFIDNFTTPAAGYTLIDTTTAGSQSSVDGTTRTVTISTSTKMTNFDFTAAGVSPTDLNGVFDYASSAGATGTAVIAYGSAASPALPLTPFAIPQDYVVFLEVLEYDNANDSPLTIDITLFNGATSSTQSLTFTEEGAQSLIIDASLFAPAVTSNVTGLTVSFTAPKATDLRLGSILIDSSTIVPEPAALGFIAPAALAMLARRRRA